MKMTLKRPHPLFMVQALIAQLIAGHAPESWEARRLRTLDRHNQHAIECADCCRDCVAEAAQIVQHTGPCEWFAAKPKLEAILLEAMQALPVLILMGIVCWGELHGLDVRRGRSARRRDDLLMVEDAA